jgi:hypothetical protein
MAKKQFSKAPAQKTALRLEAERKQANLLALREEARKALRPPPVPANLLIDAINAEGTLENIHSVMAFLEHSELVQNATTKEAEDGRWRIQQWLNDTLRYAQSQMKREENINTAIIVGLHSSESRP